VTRGAERTLDALSALARWRRWRSEPAPQSAARVAIPDGALVEEAPRSEHAAKRLLAAAGIPVTREREVRTSREAVSAAVEVGLPVVAKVVGGPHKSESGGVRLDLWTERDVEAAASDLLRGSDRVLIAEQRRGDMEIIVGAFVDRQFGPCGLIGVGGLWTEALGEAAVIAGPGSAAAVRRAMEAPAWGRLVLNGARERTFPVDRVVDVALRLMGLVEACRGRLWAIEINPLVLDGDGVVAVDALAEPVGS
jgi:acetyltransferase